MEELSEDTLNYTKFDKQKSSKLGETNTVRRISVVLHFSGYLFRVDLCEYLELISVTDSLFTRISSTVVLAEEFSIHTKVGHGLFLLGSTYKEDLL